MLPVASRSRVSVARFPCAAGTPLRKGSGGDVELFSGGSQSLNSGSVLIVTPNAVVGSAGVSGGVSLSTGAAS